MIPTSPVLLDLVTDSQNTAVLAAYNYAVTRTFILAVCAAGLGFLCTFGIKWENSKRGQTSPKDDRTEKVEPRENEETMERGISEQK